MLISCAVVVLIGAAIFFVNETKIPDSKTASISTTKEPQVVSDEAVTKEEQLKQVTEELYNDYIEEMEIIDVQYKPYFRLF